MEKQIFSLIYRTMIKITRKVKFLKYLTKFQVIYNLNTYIREKIRPKFIITKEGHKILLDEKDSLHLSVDNNWESYEKKVINKYIKEGDVVIDAGAHIGVYTLFFAEKIGNKGKVYAFEPDPTNFSILKKNIKLNGFKNVILIKKALSNKTGESILFLNKMNTGANSLIKPNYNLYPFKNKLYDKSIKVETIRLDDYFRKFNKKISFIKMDIEGEEGHALQGAKKLLEKNNINLVIEFFSEIQEVSGFGAKNLLKLLKNYFEIKNINEEEKKLTEVNIEELTNIHSPTRNLLCLRKRLINLEEIVHKN